MSKPATKPAISKRRANFGCGTALALMALGAFAYFSPRTIDEGRVQGLCEREARRQTESLGNVLIERFNQTGYTARFTISTIPLEGGVTVPANCSVRGDARNPKVVIQIEQ